MLLERYFAGTRGAPNALTRLKVWLAGEAGREPGAQGRAKKPAGRSKVAKPFEQPENLPPSITKGDFWMDRKQAAKYIGMTYKTMANWASKKKGPRFYTNGRVRYLKSDLDRWMLER